MNYVGIDVLDKINFVVFHASGFTIATTFFASKIVFLFQLVNTFKRVIRGVMK